MKIKDYVCLSESTETHLMLSVKRKLSAGYVPLGGVSVAIAKSNNSYSDTTRFAQAMVLYEEDSNDRKVTNE